MTREIKFRSWDKGVEHQVEIATKPEEKRGAHNWKGFMISGGYVLRKVNNHPFTNSRGYYTEHRLLIEENIGRFLKKDEVVHHKDGNRKNNNLDNLEVLINQSTHASIEDRGKRNPNGTMVASDPKLQDIKYRLYDKDRGITHIYTLSKLINTTFRRGCFEYMGTFTGLHDKNGVEIYESDIIKNILGETSVIKYGFQSCDCCHAAYGFGTDNSDVLKDGCGVEVIGNIYQNPDLLKETK